VEIQTNIVRAGRSAARVVLRSGDKFEAGINGGGDSERAELLEAQGLTSMEDESYGYSFSMWMPSYFSNCADSFSHRAVEAKLPRRRQLLG
jgi:hypothetical protein